MSAAARTRPRTSRQDKQPPPLDGRELDAHDLRFVTSVVRCTPAAAAVGYEDALSVGLIAYWQAARRFDAGRGTPWAVYVTPYIRHAIQDEARHADHLSRQHRREVTANGDGDPVAMAPISLEQPLLLHDAAQTRTIASTIADPARPDHDLRLTVDAALEIVHAVHPHAATALRLYYQQGWRDPDIGVLFGVSASRSSQLRKQGRGMLAELLPLDLLDAA